MTESEPIAGPSKSSSDRTLTALPVSEFPSVVTTKASSDRTLTGLPVSEFPSVVTTKASSDRTLTALPVSEFPSVVTTKASSDRTLTALPVSEFPSVVTTEASSDRTLTALPVSEFPSVVTTKIFSFLTWRDKLNVAVSIPGWETHLHSAGAWPSVSYHSESEANVYFVRDMRTHLMMCIKKYGKHMKVISINFTHKINRMGVAILLAIAEHCKILKTFKISQKCLISAHESNYTWNQSAVRGFCTIAKVCGELKEISVKTPIIDWSMAITSNIIIKLFQCDLQYLVTEMVLDSSSLLEHEGHLDLLEGFINLERLVIRRDKVNDQLLKILVSHKLRLLTLFQDEELHSKENSQLGEEFWKEVSAICPSLRVNLIFRFIMVIKDSFPLHVPLRSLVLDDLVNIITKGVLDHIVASYSSTLEYFVYMNSYIETFETGDRRLPFAVVDLVTKCKKLHSLHYGFPLSSTSVLLIAQARKLEMLMIPSVEVSFEFDWPIQADWTPEFIEWLQINGRSVAKLEEAVTELFGRDWGLCEGGRSQLVATSMREIDFMVE